MISLKCGGGNIYFNDIDCFYWLCLALRSNVVLSCDGNYEFIICGSLCRRGNCEMNMGRV